MSKHAIDRGGWPPEEREEYEALLGEVATASTVTSERLDLFERKLTDAVQAHRPWAVQVERACLRGGMGQEIRRFEDRNRALVAHDGRVLSVPAIQARRVHTDSGEVYQRELIQLWTWAEIEGKRVEALNAARTYTDKVAHYDRLLALRALCPASATPDDAARRLDIDLDDFLGRKSA